MADPEFYLAPMTWRPQRPKQADAPPSDVLTTGPTDTPPLDPLRTDTGDYLTAS